MDVIEYVDMRKHHGYRKKGRLTQLRSTVARGYLWALRGLTVVALK